MDERRANERYRVWFPMTVVTAGGEEGTAITYDVSATGVLMACPGKLEVGASVTLRFRIDDKDERSFQAKIVRVEEQEEDDGLWRFRMAASFEEEQPDLESILQRESDPG